MNKKTDLRKMKKYFLEMDFRSCYSFLANGAINLVQNKSTCNDWGTEFVFVCLYHLGRLSYTTGEGLQQKSVLKN